MWELWHRPTSCCILEQVSPLDTLLNDIHALRSASPKGVASSIQTASILGTKGLQAEEEVKGSLLLHHDGKWGVIPFQKNVLAPSAYEPAPAVFYSKGPDAAGALIEPRFVAAGTLDQPPPRRPLPQPS